MFSKENANFIARHAAISAKNHAGPQAQPNKFIISTSFKKLTFFYKIFEGEKFEKIFRNVAEKDFI